VGSGASGPGGSGAGTGSGGHGGCGSGTSIARTTRVVSAQLKRKTSDVVGSVEAPQELWPSLAALDEDPCTTAITALRLLEKEETIPPRTTVTEQPTEE